jgi:hypothetical protein
MFISMPSPLYPWAVMPQYPLNMRLLGPIGVLMLLPGILLIPQVFT